MEATALFFIFSLSIVLSSASRVPVLLGSSKEVPVHQSSVRVGHVVPSADLGRYANPFLSAELHCVVVFDDLKLSDFAVHGDAYIPDGHGSVFQHTKSFFEGAKSMLHLPAVDSSETSPEDVIRSLLRQGRPAMHVQHLSPSLPEEVKSLRYTPGTPTLWLVHLPGDSATEDRVSALRKSDGIVGAVRGQLARFNDYSFMITSKRGEETVEEEESAGVSRASARHLLASTEVVENNGDRRCTLLCFNCENATLSRNATAPCVSPAVLFCFRNMTLNFTDASNNTQILDTGKNGSTIITSVDEMTGCPVTHLDRLKVSMEVKSTNQSITVSTTLDFHFQLTKAVAPVVNMSDNASYWELVTIVAQYSGLGPAGSRCLFPPDIDHWVYAPLNQSYNCLPRTNWTHVNNFRVGNISEYEQLYCPSPPTGMNVLLTMEGIQLQAYSFTKAAGPYFDQAADCMGYFTGTTWMGIIVVSLLMVIVFLTTLAFLATDTPDRFDDPKGKNIQVQ